MHFIHHYTTYTNRPQPPIKHSCLRNNNNHPSNTHAIFKYPKVNTEIYNKYIQPINLTTISHIGLDIHTISHKHTTTNQQLQY